MESPEIKSIEAIKTICMACKTSLLNNQTKKLWTNFMKRKGEIKHKENQNFLSIQVYPEGLDMADFSPKTEFVTRAGIMVINASVIPDGMELFVIPKGTYAIFEHKGATSEFHKTAAYIFEGWLPKSDYILDRRPHFEILDERYLGPDNPNSVEDVYIPVLRK